MLEAFLELDEQPLYEKVYNEIKRSITQGDYGPGDKLPTEKEFANMFGVSRNTVRQAILSLVNEGVVVREQGRGTFVKRPPSSESLIEFRQGTCNDEILIVQRNIEPFFNPFYNEVLIGCEERLASTKYIPVYSTLNQDNSVFTYTDFSRVRAVVLMGISDRQALAAVRTLGVPIISVHEWYPDSDVQCVLIDNVYGAYLVTSHLISNGYRNIGVIVSKSKTFMDRLKGYTIALQQHGLEYKDEYVVYNASAIESLAFEGTLELIKRKIPIDAIFALTDLQALGVMSALSESGLRIPEDVAVAGYDDQVVSRFVKPSLTTVRQPARDLGKKTAEVALALLSGQRLGEGDILVKPQLVVRASTPKRSV